MSFVATSLAGPANLDRPIVDQTGLSGVFDFALEWTPGAGKLTSTGVNSPIDESSADAVEGVSFIDALREQLGISLKSGKAPLSVFVVDHVERPSAN